MICLTMPVLHASDIYKLILNLTLQPSSMGGSDKWPHDKNLAETRRIAEDIPRVHLSMRGSERGLRRSKDSSEIYKR